MFTVAILVGIRIRKGNCRSSANDVSIGATVTKCPIFHLVLNVFAILKAKPLNTEKQNGEIKKSGITK